MRTVASRMRTHGHIENGDVLGARINTDREGPVLCLGLPSVVQWKQARLPVCDLDRRLAGLRILHLTDLHLRRQWCDGYDRLIERINGAQVDLLLLTGDIVEDKRDYRPAWPIVQRLLGPLVARLGKFAVLGNHDSDMVAVHLGELGVRVIEGKRVLVPASSPGLEASSSEPHVELVGFPGVDRIDFDPQFVDDLPPKAPHHLRIALCHYPDLYDAIAPCAPDLYLSGHTHGGQICLPGGWPILTHNRGPRRYATGIHYRQPTWFIANRGLGTGKIPVRAFCPPEIIQIELAVAESTE